MVDEIAQAGDHPVVIPINDGDRRAENINDKLISVQLRCIGKWILHHAQDAFDRTECSHKFGVHIAIRWVLFSQRALDFRE